jgi:tetratricopeptide (TPR) repeat protein
MEVKLMRMDLRNTLFVTLIALITLRHWEAFGSQMQGMAESQGLIAELLISDRDVLPLQSVGVLLIVRNEGSRTITTQKTQWWPFLYLNDASSSDTKWNQYTPAREPLPSPPPPTSLILNPGEQKVWKLHLDYNALQRDTHVFAIPGRYRIKGRIGYLESAFTHVLVRKPEGVDAEAYKTLNKGELHKYFSWHTIEKYAYNQDAARDLEEFTTKHNTSSYADLAKLGLAYMWLKGVQGKRDIKQAASLLQEVARTADEDMTAQAYYYLGKVAEERGEFMDAQQYYSRALSLKINPYFKYLTEKAQVQVKQRLSQPRR